ncbi:hypothetical protein, partial [Helicobacter sp. 'CLO3_human']|uniref:hypothetical protein n=1 Tax=Helicobacter sp. 'CLO3_human' TaxID=2020249 RepID=UPI001315643A
MFKFFLIFKKGLAMQEIQRKTFVFESFVKEKRQEIEAGEKKKKVRLIKPIGGKRLKWPGVGGFRVGKSPLINRFWGKDFLS